MQCRLPDKKKKKGFIFGLFYFLPFSFWVFDYKYIIPDDRLLCHKDCFGGAGEGGAKKAAFLKISVL